MILMKTLHRFAIVFALLPVAFCAEPKAKEPPAKPEAAKVETVKGVQLTVGQLIVLASTPTLGQLMNEKLPVNMAFRLFRIVDVLKPEMERANKARADLFNEENSTASMGPDGKPNGGRIVKPEKQADVQKKLELLIKEKIDIAVTPLVIEEDLPGVKLSAADIDNLGPLITEKK